MVINVMKLNEKDNVTRTASLIREVREGLSEVIAFRIRSAM